MTDNTRILIVDDDEAIRFGTRLRLEMNGFDVTTAADGIDAIKSVLAATPDVIVMDIQMPKMDGLTALRRLKSDRSTAHIPVVIASASAQDQNDAIESGAAFFLRKPYSNEALLATVRRSPKVVPAPTNSPTAVSLK